MSGQKSICGKTGLLAAGAMVAMLAVGSYANATPVRIAFSGAAGSGYANLSVGSDTVAGDPSGAMSITGANGVFGGTTITGVQPIVPAGYMFPDETLPGSFSFLASAGASYDNLFYADGSPEVCIVNGVSTYPFSGGFLDIFGVMFTLHNHDLLALWSNGVQLGGLSYGMSLLTPVAGGYAISVTGNARAAVPEPGFLWLFGAGLLGLFAWRRSVEPRKRAARID